MGAAELVAKANAQGVRLWVEDGQLRFRSSCGKLPDDLRAELGENKVQLIAHLAEAGARSGIMLPLTANQMRLVMVGQSETDRASHNMAVAFDLGEQIELGVIEHALRELVMRHEALRSRVVMHGDDIRQEVLPPGAGVSEFRIHQGPADDVSTQSLMEREASRPFVPGDGLPIRVSALVGRVQTVLLFVFDHVFFDGRSYAIFFDELEALIGGLENPARLEAGSLQYSDAVNRLGGAGDTATNLAFWQNYLRDAPQLTSLPVDRPRTAPDHCGNTLTLSLERDVVQRLRSLSQSMNASLFTTLRALFAMFMANWTARSDLVIGSPFDTRPLGAENTIGFFATLLPLRSRVNAESTLAQIVEQTGADIAQAQIHADVPYHDLIQHLGLSGCRESVPLIQTTFSLEPSDPRRLVLEGNIVPPKLVNRGNVLAEFELLVRNRGDELDLTFTYARALFDRESVLAAAKAFAALLGDQHLSPGTPAGVMCRSLESAEELKKGAARPSLATRLSVALRLVGRCLFSDEQQSSDSDIADLTLRILDEIASTGDPVTADCAGPPQKVLATVLAAWASGRAVHLDVEGGSGGRTSQKRHGTSVDALDRLCLRLADAHFDPDEIAMTDARDVKWTFRDVAVLLDGLPSVVDFGPTDRFAWSGKATVERVVVELVLPLLMGCVLTDAADARSDDVPNVLFGSGPEIEAMMAAGYRFASGTAFLFNGNLPAAPQMIDQACADNVGILLVSLRLNGAYDLVAPVTGERERQRPALRPLPGRHVEVHQRFGQGRAPQFAVGVMRVPDRSGATHGFVPARRIGDTFALLQREEAFLVCPPDRALIAERIAKQVGSTKVDLRWEIRQGMRFYAVQSESRTVAASTDTIGLGVPSHWFPDLDQRGRDEAPPPSWTVTERIVARTWTHILGAEPAGRHTNFYAAGGNSLSAIRLAHQLSNAFGNVVTAAQVLASPTVATIASLIDGAATKDSPSTSEAIPKSTSMEGPLSPQQRRLWAADQLGLAGGRQTIPMRYEVKGALDAQRLQIAFDGIVERHEALRTVFRGGTEEPLQKIEAAPRDVLRRLDLRGVDKVRAKMKLSEFERDILNCRFDLKEGPLFIAGLATREDDSHVLLFNAHHLVIDEWSIGILWADLSALYAAGGEERALPNLDIRYLDYAAWRRVAVGSDDETRAYWRERLADAPSCHGLPIAERPDTSSYPSRTLKSKLDVGEAAAVFDLVREHATTPFTVLATMLARAVGKIAAREDVVVGAPVANRARPETSQIVGLFVETLPMRFSVPAGETFGENLARAVRDLAADFEHSAIAFSEMLRAAGIRNDGTRNPLFEITLVENTAEIGSFALGAAKLTHRATKTDEARFDLTLSFCRLADGTISLLWSANADVIDQPLLDRLARTFRETLAPAVDQDAEHAPVRLPSGEGLPPMLALFDRHATASPQRIACRAAGRTWSYGELNESGRAIGAILHELGLAAEEPVGLLGGRDGTTLSSMLGVLHAGGAYVPLDVAHPADRLRTILADCKARFVICDAENVGRLGLARLLPEGCAALILCKDGLECVVRAEGAGELLKFPGHGLPDHVGSADALAYILYTSGTTGVPKGVVVTQAGVINYICAQHDFLALDESDATGDFLCLTSLAFDTSVATIWGALLNGRSVTIASEDERYDIDFVARNLTLPERYAVAYVPPALLAEVDLPDDVEILPRIVVSGEASSRAIIERLADRTLLINEYGPTEASVCATWHRFSHGDDPRTIGRPIAGARIELIEADGRKAEVGEDGEVWIGGHGVARGYLGRDDLTKDRFVFDQAGQRWYRTGDWARRQANGDFLFLGRRDGQVKIRGQRIELDEISAHIERLDAVRDALVVVVDADIGRQQIAAHVIAGKTGSLSDQALCRVVRDALQQRLPDFMIPTLWAVHASWPLTVNGKIDAGSLGQPVPIVRLEDSVSTVAPEGKEADDPARRSLAKIWKDLFGTSPALSSDFFEAGGDSITALQMAARARIAGHELAVRAILQAKDFAAIVEAAREQVRTTELPAPQALANKGLEQLGLLPMQAEFFEHARETEVDLFSQSRLFSPAVKLTITDVRRASQLLMSRNQALRSRFLQTDAGWRTAFSEEIEEDAIQSVVRIALGDLERETVEAACEAQRRRLDIRFGPLVRLALLDAPSGQRLFVVCHHLVVDAISWERIEQDLTEGLSQEVESDPAGQPTSYAQAIQAFDLLVNDPAIGTEVPAWQGILSRVPKYAATPAEHERPRVVSGEFAGADAAGLIEQLRRRGAGQAIVVAALAKAALEAGLIDGGAVPIAVETHGRDRFDDPTIAAGTVGWFSATYPVVLDRSQLAGLAFEEAVAEARRALDEVPQAGRHFDTLRMAGAFGEQAPEPALLINYFGTQGFDVPHDDDALLRRVEEPRKAGFRTIPMVPRAVTLVCGATRGGFAYTLHCDPDSVSARQAVHLARAFEDSLTQAAKVGTRVEWPATGSQVGIFYEELAEPGIYLMALRLDLSGVDADALCHAFRALVARHDILRARFRFDAQGELVQSVDDEFLLDWQTADLTGQSIEAIDQSLERAAQEDGRQSFDLERGPLHRLRFFRTAKDRGVLLWTIHHSIFDGWSLPIALFEVKQFHDALLAGEPAALSPVPSFGSYARWYHERDKGTSLQYWTKRLTGFTSATDLPRLAQGYETASTRIFEEQLDETESVCIGEAAKRLRTTPSTILRAAWALTLAYYAGSEDVVFGVVQSGRPYDLPEMQGAVGLFVATLPTRVRLSPDSEVTSWLADLQEDSIAEMEHGFVPLHRIESEAASTEGPLFRSVFAYENYPWSEDDDSERGLSFETVRSEEGTNFELLMQAKLGRRLALRLTSRSANIDRSKAGEICARYVRYVRALCGEVRRVAEIIDRPSLAQAVMLPTLETTAPARVGIHSRFMQIASLHPQALAIADHGENLTYVELARLSGRIAAKMHRAGVRRNDRVAIVSPRGIGAIGTILAVLRLGGCYVPIDSGYPMERVKHLVELVGARFAVLTSDADLTLGESVTTLPIEALAENDGIDDTVPAIRGDSAYIMFTSGSTGTPKGVAVPDEAIERLVVDPDYFTLGVGARVAHVSNLAFDASTFEIWGALCNGATIEVIEQNVVQDPASLQHALTDRGVTVMFLTTALFSQLARVRPGVFASLSYLLFGGEKLDPAVVENIRSAGAPTHLVHVYGPTENTTFSTAYEIVTLEDDYPIGRFIAGTAGTVVSTEGHPLPPGQTGQLLLCGQGLAQGYHARPDLTAAAFVDLGPAGKTRRYYRTGDLVRVREDGAILFEGRTDRQIKLRGFRIEPSEIRAQILTFDGVCEAHVFAAGREEKMRLVAAVVPQAGFGTAETPEAMRSRLVAALEDRLPEFMVPGQWTFVDSLPVNSNGKIDEQALASSAAAREEAIVNADLPRDSIEYRLLKLWSGILSATRISVEDNFYAIGGSSISAIKLRHQIAAEFDVEIGLSELLHRGTIARIAEYIRNGSGNRTGDPVQVMQEGTEPGRIVFVHPAGGTIFTYLPLTWALPDDIPILGIQAYGVERDEPLPRDITNMARTYLDNLPDPDCPTLFIGASFGGLVSYEMARLAAANGSPATAILLDSQATDNVELAATINPVTLDVFRGKLVKYNGMYPGISDNQIARYHRLYNHHLMMLASDILPPSNARTVLLMATADKIPAHQDAMANYWQIRCENFELFKVGGDHSTVLEPPQLETVLKTVLAERHRLLVERL